MSHVVAAPHPVSDYIHENHPLYAAVIKDPNTPVVELEVIVNDSRAVPLFEQLMKNFDIPGEVVVRP